MSFPTASRTEGFESRSGENLLRGRWPDEAFDGVELHERRVRETGPPTAIGCRPGGVGVPGRGRRAVFGEQAALRLLKCAG
jgi:hypothetical protein